MAKILVVEDDPFLRNLLVKKLTDAQYKIDVAVTGEEALERINNKPDLVLLDIILPGINGFEILKRVKDNNQLKNIPIVVLTNLGSEEDIKKATDLGAEDFWIKAYLTPDEILNKIKKILTDKND
ncbi:MAG TPA: response regulator [Candidatus Portnoybacteria bacterium]|nr:response regulator [Candidatus Portnoybacteria bacterium]